MADDIAEGQPEFSVAEEVHRLIAECREGGKSAKDTDHKKRPSFP